MADLKKTYKIVEFVVEQNDGLARHYQRNPDGNPGDLHSIDEEVLYVWVANIFRLSDPEAQRLVDSAVSEDFLVRYDPVAEVRTKNKVPNS